MISPSWHGRFHFRHSAWIAPVLIAAAGLVAAAAWAAVQPKVENPHGRFKGDCALCHGPSGWKPEKISAAFNHASYGFPLTGAHAAAKCMACHATLDFTDSRNLCATCHQDPHRGEMGTDCARCHSSRSFIDRTAMVRRHQSTRFPLTGSHAQIDCESCHKPAAQGQMQFVGTHAECASCHMDNYRATKNPDHVAGGFPLDCSTCHSTLTWSTRTFDHDKTAFPLTGAHRLVACNQCHGDGVYKGKTTDCYGCHKADYDNTNNPAHAAAGFPTGCLTCHATTSWTTATFNHNTQTAFPLSGAHTSVTCQGCHGDGVFKGKSTLCYACHQTDYAGATSPAHQAGGFPTTCETCHGTANWTSSTFNHSTSTTFPLTGAHQAVACSGCHGDNVYKGKSTLCYSCHASDFTGAADPKHSAAPATFVTTCESCHTTTAWTGVSFDHTANTTFPLTGAHIGLDCNGCHGDNVFKGKSSLCYSCHTADYNGTTQPPHQSSGLPNTCDQCHTTTTWGGGTFNHNTNTTFPLTGAHQAVACSGCHGDGVYKGKSTLCYSCHADKYATTVLNHAAAGFATTCESCHTTTAWNPGAFNHTTSTTFPLTGAHLALACSGCHGDNVFKGKSTLCYSCHTTDYNGTADPKHGAAAFATTCESCHTTTAWTGATFDHTANTSFPLTGGHIGLDCNQCHGDGVFKGKSTLCYSCHTADYNGATNPAHQSAGFPTTCETCHSTANWTSSTFNHSTSTTFPLTGAHQAVACNGCHGDGVYKGKSTLCYSCHATDFATTVLNHTAAGFATTCENCHTTTAWNPGTFNHTTSTTFPLTGAHLPLACNQCHGDNVFKGKSTLCYSCHTADYNGTTDPKHSAAAFAATCESCHNTTAWTGATFDHTANTTFPLTGAHVGLDCNKCHSSNVYKGLSTLCYSCHATDYATTVVNHTAAGFGTACETCHTTTAWSGGQYTAHDTQFPIYSGTHKGRWSNCTDCHTNTSNYLVFACYGACHPVASVDKEHVGRSGYVQGAGDSQKCYSCHPKGSTN